MPLFSKKKEEIIAVIDVASASIGGMLIKKILNADPEIISSVRVPVNFLMDVNFQAFWRCTQKSLSDVLNRLLKDYPKGPDKVLCVFSGIWVVSQTRIMKIKKEKPFEINKDLLDRIIEEEIKTFKRSIPRNMPNLEESAEILEYKIMKASLNGYATEDPFNKKAKRFDFYLYIGLIDKNVKGALQEIFLRNFGDVDIQFFSRPFVIFNVLKKIINTEDGFVFVDIGSETSDAALVRRNVLEEIVSFPRGRNFLLRRIASGLNTFINDAGSILNSYQEGRLAMNVLEKTKPIIDSAKKEWCDYLEKALKEISQEIPLPRKVIAISEKGVLSYFLECIKSESFSKFTILAKPFDLEKISVDGLKNHFTFKRSVDADSDIFLMLEALFADKFLK